MKTCEMQEQKGIPCMKNLIVILKMELYLIIHAELTAEGMLFIQQYLQHLPFSTSMWYSYSDKIKPVYCYGQASHHSDLL